MLIFFLLFLNSIELWKMINFKYFNRLIAEKSAVAIVSNDKNQIKGVIRFTTSNDDAHVQGCVVDGVIDGLAPGDHGIHIHENGDISNGCESLGAHYNPRKARHGSPDDSADQRHVGDLGNIEANSTGRATFRFTDKLLTVGDIIGRSVVVTENADDFGSGDNEQSKIDGNSGARLACGIIARSAGIFQNFKQICACDGVTIWYFIKLNLLIQLQFHFIKHNYFINFRNERDKPLAGSNRSNS